MSPNIIDEAMQELFSKVETQAPKEEVLEDFLSRYSDGNWHFALMMIIYYVASRGADALRSLIRTELAAAKLGGDADGQQSTTDSPSGDEFLRGMLIIQGKHDAVAREEVRFFSQAEEDVCKAERLYQHVVESGDASAVAMSKDNITRRKRHRSNCKQRLAMLGIRKRSVEPGDPFDALIHSRCGTIPATHDQQYGAVAQVESPLFEWKDHAGQSQYIAANVICYADSEGAEVASVDRDSNETDR